MLWLMAGWPVEKKTPHRSCGIVRRRTCQRLRVIYEGALRLKCVEGELIAETGIMDPSAYKSIQKTSSCIYSIPKTCSSI